MADEQSKIAAEQVPIYNKAVETQLGTSNSGTGEGMSTTSSTEIQSPQPPASNPGADDPTAGISEGAGGLSSTAHIESPVPNHDQSLFSTVKNMFGFGAAPEEIKAEDKEPAENATTAPASSLLAGSAAAATGVAGVTMGSSESSSIPATQSTTTSSTLPVSGSQKGTYLDYQQSANSDSSAFPSSQTLPIRSTPGGSLPSDSSSSEAAKTDTPSRATESIDRNTASSTTNDSNNNMTETTTTSSSDNNTQERSEPKEHKPPQPADGKPTASKGIENRDAIPTAGGKRLGEENWGESKIVPDDPKPASDSSKGVSSSEGQPTEQVKDNTAKNTGGATGGPQHGNSEGGKGEEKEKLVDKIKDKLHMGKK